MANTFYALLDLADLSTSNEPRTEVKPSIVVASQSETQSSESQSRSHGRPSLHYNIQIHLPATKDIEVFNAIFKSLKEHLLD